MSHRDASARELGNPGANSPDRHAARAAAIHSEIRSLGETALKAQPSTSVWSRNISDLAPFAVIKRKASRFRLPRLVMSELLDQFISSGEDAPSSLKTLIVVAHPDDESIGAGARLRNLGDVYLVDVTHGAPRDVECARRHGFATPDEYAEARHRELLDAIAVAGLAEDRLILLGFVDGETSLRLVELCLRITELIDAHRPQVVLTHPYEGGHTDHDATAFAVHLACGVLRREGIRTPAIFELASYYGRKGERVVQRFLPHERADRDQRVLHLTKRDRDLKERIFACFTSQKSVLSQFSTHIERFRPAPRYVFTKPPHEGLLNYERFGNAARGRTWREHALDALRSLRMRRD